MREVHLICNAHLDVMWLWDWEEGAAETLSTFRTAARLAEQFDNFVFCHNEALLYEWIEEYEPSLFKKIQKLVKKGKWHIMGGWYLQPDCNLPSGEGFIRQITKGNEYFKEKFGLTFETAINFDSFGHTQGMVQIMKRFGYKNYLICRPTSSNITDIPDEFEWVGYDGSKVYVRRHFELYNSPLGEAKNKVENLIKEKADSPLCVLWGVGNHGGGPSEKDLSDLAELKSELKKEGVELLHSTPDKYFDATKKSGRVAPEVNHSLTYVNTGCFTSQSLVKKYYRKVERELFATEKIMSAAVMKGLMEWDDEISKAERDMLFLQFHDILPGTAIKSVEDAAIRCANHGLEILSRIKARAYFALSNTVKYSACGNYPILVWNPLPYETERTVEVEFNLKDQNWKKEFTFMKVIDDNKKELPAQIEKESSNLNLDWRKHVVFNAKLKPMSVNFFECKPYTVPEKPTYPEIKGVVDIPCGELLVRLNADTGLISSVVKNGVEYLGKEGFNLAVWSDSEDPWAMNQDDRLGNKITDFTLLSATEGSQFSGVKKEIPSCRIVEDGAVRTVVEAVFGTGLSRAQYRYTFNKLESTFNLDILVVFGEKDKCLKLEIPIKEDGRLMGQRSFGREALRKTGGEDFFLDWCGVFNEEGIAIINDGVYGGSYENGVLSLSLLRTSAYTGHPIEDREILEQDRYTDRIDLGERKISFLFAVTDEDGAERLSTQRANSTMAFSFFPNGEDRDSSFIEVYNKDVTLVAMYKKKKDLIVRLYNGSATEQASRVQLKPLNIDFNLILKPFEFKTFVLKKGKQPEEQII